MIKSRILYTLLAAFALAVPAASQVAPSAAKQWSVDTSYPFRNQLSYGIPYSLYNNSRRIGYEVRKYGINLGWDGDGGGYFEFRRQAPAGVRDHRKGPIAGDEKVALYSTQARQYVIYEDRGGFKAALGWSSTPDYEWQIHDQSASGERVKFALFNLRINKYLIYEVRDQGINLGFFSNQPTPAQSFSVGLRNQQIIQGFVPYLGSFGENTRGNLLTVQNASSSATLLFVKPGKSTINCGDPNATVLVAPRASMTADQMKILYGSVTPRLPITFLACLAAPTQQLVTLTFLNITYRLDP